MEQLNIHNYEAFYLDFLEGNLNEEETSQLFCFLDENPSLKIEVENFEALDNSIYQLDESFKNDLKQVDFELDEVNQMTMNSFLIAQFEQQLSAKKENEVEDFLVQHPKFKRDQQYIKSTILVPDLSISYPNKQGLKKSELRFLWPIIFSVAAILVILFLVMNLTSTPLEGIKKAVISQKKSFIKNDSIILYRETNSIIKKEKRGMVKLKKSSPIILIADEETKIVAQIDTNSIKIEIIDNEDVVIQKVPENNENNALNSLEIVTSKTRVKSNEAFDCVSALDKYPIESFTNNLSTIIKKQVEFKTCRNAKSNKTGFYLKIGKFIISKQTT